ncbi:hypothetical protein GCM10023238_23470 [Streptomyces heliomycini]
MSLRCRHPRQAVGVDPALQVVALVLQAPGEEPGAVDGDRLAGHREALDDRVVVPLRPRLQAGQGQTALRAAHHHPVRLDRLRVHHVAQVADVLVVRAVVDEHPERHADLVGGQAHAPRRVHRGEQVVHQADEFRAEVGDLPAGRVQRRVAEQGEGPHTSVDAGDGAVSHGGKSTVLPAAPVSRWCLGSGVRTDLDRLRSHHVAVRHRRGAYARRIEN